eukprot:946661-Amorphochlora_amoeboformis.AAC.1
MRPPSPLTLTLLGTVVFVLAMSTSYVAESQFLRNRAPVQARSSHGCASASRRATGKAFLHAIAEPKTCKTPLCTYMLLALYMLTGSNAHIPANHKHSLNTHTTGTSSRVTHGHTYPLSVQVLREFFWMLVGLAVTRGMSGEAGALNLPSLPAMPSMPALPALP